MTDIIVTLDPPADIVVNVGDFGALTLGVLLTLGVVASAATLAVSGGANFAKGEIGYIHTDGTVRKAINSGTEAQAYARVICVASAGVASGASGYFLCASGIVTGLSGGTAGALIFVDSVAGALGSAAGTWSKVVGYWLSSTVAVFDPCPAIAPMNFG